VRNNRHVHKNEWFRHVMSGQYRHQTVCPLGVDESALKSVPSHWGDQVAEFAGCHHAAAAAGDEWDPKCDDVWVPFDPPPVDPADILSGIHQYITSNKNNDIPLFMSDKTLQPLQYEETNTVANIAGTYVLISMCIILGHLLNPLIGCLMLLLLMMVVV